MGRAFILDSASTPKECVRSSGMCINKESAFIKDALVEGGVTALYHLHVMSFVSRPSTPAIISAPSPPPAPPPAPCPPAVPGRDQHVRAPGAAEGGHLPRLPPRGAPAPPGPGAPVGGIEGPHGSGRNPPDSHTGSAAQPASSRPFGRPGRRRHVTPHGDMSAVAAVAHWFPLAPWSPMSPRDPGCGHSGFRRRCH